MIVEQKIGADRPESAIESGTQDKHDSQSSMPCIAREGRSTYEGTRVVVLGASGFVGRWVARLLYLQGAQIQFVVRDSRAAEKVCSEFGIRGAIYEQDISDPAAVCKLFRKLRPSITFNLVGYGVDHTERDETTAYRINAEMLQTLCDAVLPVRDPAWPAQDIVHVGTAFEYGSLDGNLDEEAEPHPITLYGSSKLAGTKLFTRLSKSRGIKGVTARLFTVYGPGEHADRLVPSLLRTAQTGRPLLLTDGQQKRDFTYVEDVASGLLRLGLSSAEPGQIVNLATGRLTSVRSFVETAAQVLGIPPDRLQFGTLPTRREEMQHSAVTVERLRQLTGWVPSTGIVEGIRKTLAFKQKGDRSEVLDE